MLATMTNIQEVEHRSKMSLPYKHHWCRLKDTVLCLISKLAITSSLDFPVAIAGSPPAKLPLECFKPPTVLLQSLAWMRPQTLELCLLHLRPPPSRAYHRHPHPTVRSIRAQMLPFRRTYVICAFSPQAAQISSFSPKTAQVSSSASAGAEL